jgi:hypothetical protein
VADETTHGQIFAGFEQALADAHHAVTDMRHHIEQAIENQAQAGFSADTQIWLDVYLQMGANLSLLEAALAHLAELQTLVASARGRLSGEGL